MDIRHRVCRIAVCASVAVELPQTPGDNNRSTGATCRSRTG